MEMQIKTRMRYNVTPTRMPYKKKKEERQNNKVWALGNNAEKLKLLYIIRRNAKWCKNFGKHFGSFFKI